VLPADRRPVTLTTADGFRLVGELALPLGRPPAATLIFLHPLPTAGGMMDSLLLFEGVIPGHKAVPAGVMTWLNWAYVAGDAAINLARPTPTEQRVAMVARPVYVMDRTVFDHYRDIASLRNHVLFWNIVFELIAVIAAWKFGEWAAGPERAALGALVAGGMMAVLPLFHSVGSTARPLAIAFGLVALCMLALSRRRPLLGAVFFGLAIGTRIEMVILLPLIAAIVISEAGWRRGLLELIKGAGVALVAFLVISPWWLITWFGNIRSIVGARLMSAPDNVSHATLLYEFSWLNALLIPLLLMLLAFGQTVRRPRGWMIPAAAALIVATMFIGHSNLSYQTPPILATIFVAALGVAVLPRRAVPIATGLVIASLLLASVQSVRQARAFRANYVPNDATAWVEHHVPPGTRLYWRNMLSVFPLPTEQAATFMWNEITDDHAWRTKMGWAVGFRGSAPADADLPRATSDELMLKDRANVRLWFILGGRTSDVKLPRFDVRQYSASGILGVVDAPEAFRKSGGVLVWVGPRLDEATFGKPVESWTKNQVDGTFIYVSPDVHLIP